MTQQSTNNTFHVQTNQHKNVNLTDANSVEFRNGTPSDLATNAKRIWVDQATPALKYTVDGVNIVGAATSADLTSLTAQVSTNTTNIAANTTAITNIGNASPKGTYPTLAALQAAFPTGTTGIYVVTADGNWYYWNGIAWTSGGVYQSTSLPPNAGDQLVVLYNLANSATITTGAYLGAGGVPVADNYSYTDYIPVTVGSTYSFYGPFSKTAVANTYNASNVYLSTIFTNDVNITGSYNNFHYTVPAGVAFMRFNMNNATQNQLTSMVIKSSAAYPATYTPYGYILLSSLLAQGITNSLNLSVIYTDNQFNTSLGRNNLVNKNNTNGATAVGYSALRNNTTDGSTDAGLYNTAVGYSALMSNTIGNHNTAVGWQAAFSNTIGTGLTAIGEDSFLSNTTGTDNTGVGIRTGQNITTGTANTAIGSAALYSANPLGAIVTGARNTAVGSQAGSRTVADTNCTYLGFFANKDIYTNSYTNSTAIGSNALVTKSNQVILGDTSVTEVDTYGDFQCFTNGRGLIMLSPNGTKYKLTVSNAGALTVTAI